MRIIRLYEPQASIDLISPFLLPDTDFGEDEMRGMLFNYLQASPETINISVAVDGESIHGLTIVVAEQGFKHAFMLQAWVSNKAPKFTAKKMLHRACLWAEDLGRESIRMETRREDRGMTRRFGFEKLSSIMELRFNDDMFELKEDETIEIATEPPAMKVETDHGQEIENSQSHSGTDRRPERIVGLSETEDRDGSDFVLGTVGGGLDSRDAGAEGELGERRSDDGFRPAKERPNLRIDR